MRSVPHEGPWFIRLDYAPPQFVVDAFSAASQQPMLQQYTRGPEFIMHYSDITEQINRFKALFKVLSS